ncbi:FGGY-family carbohydrate kinase [Clostridium swellfunianum]|uniref:FGGY-family carbohydrate kinase n=1 Tax=Clostridium swellfunianum TaxID=1367462 RepID=UPI002030F37E|nr:FGGY-family carbohydrate kinase [Clostridium swellfunianum]MCM0649654.1 FGGY-family carbohydrate kinase [Clostridium swellfunianum]
MLLLGLDIGTTHIKAAVVNENLELTALHIEDNNSVNIEGKGQVYLAEDLWSIALRCIKEAIKTINPLEITAISVSSMAEAGVPLSADKQPLYPVIPWNDMRAKEQMDRLKKELGGYEIYKKTGLIAHPKHSIARLMWLRENEKELYEKTEYWLSVGDYIIFKLSGEIVTDSTLACRTMLYNISEKAWDKDLVSYLGTKDILPRVLEPGKPAGTLLKEIAEETGISKATVIVAGAHDHICAAMALGIKDEDEILDSMGTSEVFVGREDEPVLTEEFYNLGFNQGAFPGGGYYWMTSTPASGGSIEWLRKIISIDREIPYNFFDNGKKIDELSKVIYMPYLSGSGTPHVDPLRRGCFIGLSTDTDVFDLIKAIYEGVSYEGKWVIDTLERLKGKKINKIKAVGGSTKNSTWMKVKCNILNKKLLLSSMDEASAVGAAVLAGIGIKALANIKNSTALKQELNPDSELISLYEKGYERYKNKFEDIENVIRMEV